MLYIFIIAVFLPLISFLVWCVIHIKMEGKKQQIPLDKLKSSERQLNAFKNLSPNQRLEHFEELRKAIGRLHALLSQAEENSYDLLGTLNHDYLFTDVRMLEYYNAQGDLSYTSVLQAQMLHDYPNGEYSIINPLMGKYSQYGAEKISVEMAIDTYLLDICDRWLQEIAQIEQLIYQKAESN